MGAAKNLAAASWLAIGAAVMATAPTDGRADVTLNPGWEQELFFWDGSKIHRPTAMAFSPSGDLFVAQLVNFDTADGKVTILRDVDDDGMAETVIDFAVGFSEPTGIAFDPNGALWVSDIGRITRVRDTNGDDVGDVYEDMVTGLPPATPDFNGDHRNHGIVYGNDGFMYFGVADTRLDQGPHPLEMTIQRVSLDGQTLETYATGIRNVYGLAISPSGEIFFNDQDDVGGAEELNHLKQGEWYGWPDHEGVPPPGSSARGPIEIFDRSLVGLTFGSGGHLFQTSHYGRLWKIVLTPSGDTFATSSTLIGTGGAPITVAYDAAEDEMYYAEFAGNWSKVFRFEATDPPECFSDPECDDSNPCTDDFCSAGECENDDNSDPCDDGVVCTVGDICTDGACAPGSPTASLCDDSNVCTTDTCDVAFDCQYAPASGSCDDGVSCTVNDICTDGICYGSDNCSAGEFCYAPTQTCEADLGDITDKGTQPGLAHPIVSSDDCASCHSAYDPNSHHEPFDTWAGSMMAQSARDPLFWAALDVANNDRPGIGDWCLRCHATRAWLEGRSHAPAGRADGCALQGKLDEPGGDFDGVTCHLCHRMMINPAPPAGESAVYTENARYWLDDSDCGGEGEPCRRAGYDYSGPETPPPHPWAASPYHESADQCGNCHNVTNPIKNLIDAGGTDTGIPFPIERTHMEWQNSSYALQPDHSGACQSCHMADASGSPAYACSDGFNDRSGDLPVHEFVGGNAWVPLILREEAPGLGLSTELTRTRDAALENLRDQSVAIEIVPGATPDPNQTIPLDVKVTNLTGHKLPTGYPEGRRVWIHVRGVDANGGTFFESGAWDPLTGDVVSDPQLKVYEVKQGVWDPNSVSCVTESGGAAQFHFVENDCVALDNRIPPLGFVGGTDPEIQPVNYVYPETTPGSGELVNFDVTTYQIQIPADTATPVGFTAELRYQTASREYIAFLSNEASQNGFPDDCLDRSGGPIEMTRAEILEDYWERYDRSPPVRMGAATWGCAGGDPDSDADGVCDAFDNCPHEANPGQEDVGGIGPFSLPDRSGDDCQCGDNDDDGRVTTADRDALRLHLIGQTPAGFETDKCAAGSSCDVGDFARLARRLRVVGPELGRTCDAAQP